MTAPMPDYTITARVRGVWKKLADWYGADVITKNFGAFPPREWCEEIDAIKTRAQLDQVLGNMRMAHPTFPPRFPQFEAIVAKVVHPVSTDGPSIQERLASYALRNHRPTPHQLRSPWTYLFRGSRSAGDFAITGVVIPADPVQGAPILVRVEDLQLPEDAAA